MSMISDITTEGRQAAWDGATEEDAKKLCPFPAPRDRKFKTKSMTWLKRSRWMDAFMQQSNRFNKIRNDAESRADQWAQERRDQEYEEDILNMRVSNIVDSFKESLDKRSYFSEDQIIALQGAVHELVKAIYLDLEKED